MSDQSQGPGWWVASDGKWYAPELHPDRQSAAEPSQPPPGDVPPPADVPPPGDVPPSRRSRRNLVIALVVLVGLVVVAIVAMSGDEDSGDADLSANEETTTSQRSTTTTEARTTTTAAEREEDLTVESGFSTGVDSIGTRYTSVGALVTNPNATLAAYDVSVVFNLVDASGAILDTTTESVPYIPANSTVPVAPLQIGFDNPTEPGGVEVNITGTVEEDTGWAGVDFMMYQGVDLDVTGAKVAPGSFGGTDLSFTATNPSDQVTEFGSWSCVLKRGGAIVGGESSGISDPIVPGASVLVTSSISVDGLTADEVICRAFA